MIEDNIVSKIKEYADKVKVYEEDEPGERVRVPP